MNKNLKSKIRESLTSVLPVALVVLCLSVTLVPLTGEMVFLFLIGTVLLVIGIGLFTLGADTSMMVMGQKIGSAITGTKKLWLILLTCLIVGIVITVAEPDLRVLADQAPIASDTVLILSVALGVGVFLSIAFLRVFLQIRLSLLLGIFYTAAFALALSPLIDSSFIPVAFDSGGVTTGPITVPFILSLGIGLASIRGDATTDEDTFGLVALCSIGPIITILVLGAISGKPSASPSLMTIPDYTNASQVFGEFLHALPHYFAEVALAVAPIIALSVLFFLIFKTQRKRELSKIAIGFLFTFLGLVLFLTGVNVGFMPVGSLLGTLLAEGSTRWLLIPIGALLGWFIVSAEPAVHVLRDQVQDITQGRIRGKTLTTALSAGMACSVALSMFRVITSVSIVWFLIPGYVFSLIMTFFTPNVFTAVAFDSGGVVSGPMTATFLLPFAMGASAGVGGDIASDAFGIVAMVAMTPLITIQILGLKDRITRRAIPVDLSEFDEIIVLAEV